MKINRWLPVLVFSIYAAVTNAQEATLFVSYKVMLGSHAALTEKSRTVKVEYDPANCADRFSLLTADLTVLPDPRTPVANAPLTLQLKKAIAGDILPPEFLVFHNQNRLVKDPSFGLPNPGLLSPKKNELPLAPSWAEANSSTTLKFQGSSLPSPDMWERIVIKCSSI